MNKAGSNGERNPSVDLWPPHSTVIHIHGNPRVHIYTTQEKAVASALIH